MYSVNLELSQEVVLLRDIAISGFATTWEQGGIGYASPSQVEEAIRGSVEDYMNLFLNDYLEVNPK